MMVSRLPKLVLVTGLLVLVLVGCGDDNATPTPTVNTDPAVTPTLAPAEVRYLWPDLKVVPNDVKFIAKDSVFTSQDQVNSGESWSYELVFRDSNRSFVIRSSKGEPAPSVAGVRETLQVRGGKEAVLGRNTSQISLRWTEFNNRVGILGNGMSREELLAIAESLTPFTPAEFAQRVQENANSGQRGSEPGGTPMTPTP